MHEISALQFMKQKKGYLRTADFISKGIHPSKLKQPIQEAKVEKIKWGLYRLADKEHNPMRDLVDVCEAIPKAVICLYSALSHYGLTTFVPTEIMVAVPQGYHAPKLTYPPVQVFHFSEKQYEAGIDTVKIKEGTYRIYNAEKSVCDAFRFRRKLGDDVAKESLFTYLEKSDKSVKKLTDMATICRMSNIMRPYIEARMG